MHAHDLRNLKILSIDFSMRHTYRRNCSERADAGYDEVRTPCGALLGLRHADRAQVEFPIRMAPERLVAE